MKTIWFYIQPIEDCSFRRSAHKVTINREETLCGLSVDKMLPYDGYCVNSPKCMDCRNSSDNNFSMTKKGNQ